MKQLVAYFIFQEKTVFMPFKFLYPECFFHIKDHPKLYPMQCFLTDSCPGSNCGEILAKRVHYLFENIFPQAELLVSYFKYRDKPNSIRAAVFTEDFATPRLITVNPWAFKKFQKAGVPYKWFPTDEYSFMCGSAGIIPIEGLIR